MPSESSLHLCTKSLHRTVLYQGCPRTEWRCRMSEEEHILRDNPRPAMICNAIMKAELLDVKSKKQNCKYALVAHCLYTKPDRVSILQEIMKAYSPNIEVATTKELWDGPFRPPSSHLWLQGSLHGQNVHHIVQRRPIAVLWLKNLTCSTISS